MVMVAYRSEPIEPPLLLRGWSVQHVACYAREGRNVGATLPGIRLFFIML